MGLALAGVALAGVALATALLLGPLGGRADAAAPLGAPRFVEVAADAGLAHRYDGDFVHFTGGGVAAFDCNDDGQPDLYFAGGSEPAALYRNESEVGGALRFSAVPSVETDLLEVVGAYPLDLDGDARIDLAVLRVGENVLLRGLGDCRFERANEALGFDGGDVWTGAFSATWEGSAQLATLAFGNYLDLGEYEKSVYACLDNELVRPAPDGAGYGPPTALSPGWCALSMLFSDWDGSGRRDLRVSNDRQYYREGEEQLWRTEPGAAPRLYTADDGWETLRIWGMGIASHDLTGDGLPEYYLTSQGDNKLQTLTDGNATPRYADMALRLGATAHRPYEGDTTMPSTAWHPQFADLNNDGFIDLFVTKGNVEAMTEYAAQDPNNLLLGQADGTFVEAAPAAGIVTFERGRGAAVVDLNLDGLLDMVVVNRRENVDVWRNLGAADAGAAAAGQAEPMGNWLALRVQQDGPNRDAIGAWVEVRAGDRVERREITVGGGHAGGALGWTHFGLGSAGRATVTVVWPDGERGPDLEVEANSFGIVERGTPAVQEWTSAP